MRFLNLVYLILVTLLIPGCANITYSKGGSGEIYFAGIGREGGMDADVKRVSLTADSEYFHELNNIKSGWLAMPDSRPDHRIPNTITFRWGDNLENKAIFQLRKQLPREIIENLSIDDGFHIRDIYYVVLDFRVENGKASCYWSAPLWSDVSKLLGSGTVYPVSTAE